jgi:hypothetical protein
MVENTITLVMTLNRTIPPSFTEIGDALAKTERDALWSCFGQAMLGGFHRLNLLQIVEDLLQIVANVRPLRSFGFTGGRNSETGAQPRSQ